MPKDKKKESQDSVPPGRPRLCKLVAGPNGYGFNLHGEKGRHGQFIRAVDDGRFENLWLSKLGLCSVRISSKKAVAY